MPGKSWRNLGPSSPAATGAKCVLPTAQSPLQAAQASSPKLNSLLNQRNELEQKMQALSSGGNQLSARDAARFPVATFAERRAQQRAWESERDTLRQRALEARRATPNQQPASEAEPLPAPRSALDLRAPQVAESEVGRWLNSRDQQRRSARTRTRDRLKPISEMGRSIGNAADQLRDLDQRLQDIPADEERDKLRERLQEANKAARAAERIANIPAQAVEKTERFWQQRESRFSNPMDQFGAYAARRRERLSTETGGSGDLFERMERNRERALERRRERQIETLRDEKRSDRERALERRKQSRREEEQDQARRDRARP